MLATGFKPLATQPSCRAGICRRIDSRFLLPSRRSSAGVELANAQVEDIRMQTGRVVRYSTHS